MSKLCDCMWLLLPLLFVVTTDARFDSIQSRAVLDRCGRYPTTGGLPIRQWCIIEQCRSLYLYEPDYKDCIYHFFCKIANAPRDTSVNCTKIAPSATSNGQKHTNSTQKCAQLRDYGQKLQCRIDIKCGRYKRNNEDYSKCASSETYASACAQRTTEDDRLHCRVKHLCGHVTDRQSCASEVTARCRHLAEGEEKIQCFQQRKAHKAAQHKIRECNGRLSRIAQQRRRTQKRGNFVKQQWSPKRSAHTEMTTNSHQLQEVYYQGDLDITDSQLQQLNSYLATLERNSHTNTNNHRGKRKVIEPNSAQFRYNFWDSTKPVPYQFEFGFDAHARGLVRQALDMWQRNTCVRFVEDPFRADRLEFVHGVGCSSFIGRVGGVQQISLSRAGCLELGIIAHEIGHALGLLHEQARPDQMQKLYVIYDNIDTTRWGNFLPYEENEVNSYNQPYDFGSVMHYDAYAFARDTRRPTLESIDLNYQNTMGQRVRPSFVDVAQINMAYCSTRCPNKLSCQHGGYSNPNKCDECLCPDGFSGRLCETVQATSCGREVLVQNENPVHIANQPSRIPTQCAWLIKTRPGQNITLQFTDKFVFPCKASCSRSHVEVKIGPDFRSTGYRLCCSHVPFANFTSQGHEMVLILRNLEVQNEDIQFRAILTATSHGAGTNPQKRSGSNQPRQRLYTKWSDWSQGCSQSCGGCGRQIRTRRCIPVIRLGRMRIPIPITLRPSACELARKEERRCNVHTCPSHITWLFGEGDHVDYIENGCCTDLQRDKSNATVCIDPNLPIQPTVISNIVTKMRKSSLSSLLKSLFGADKMKN